MAEQPSNATQNIIASSHTHIVKQLSLSHGLEPKRPDHYHKHRHQVKTNHAPLSNHFIVKLFRDMCGRAGVEIQCDWPEEGRSLRRRAIYDTILIVPIPSHPIPSSLSQTFCVGVLPVQV